MKKLIFILAISLILVPLSTNATSGACSDHGGVNCAAGADWDGSVTCNDGQSDSSVQYNYMSECEAKSTCYLLLYSSGCTSEDSYINQEKYCADLSKLDVVSGRSRYAPEETQATANKCIEDLKKCREEITQHQANLLLYDKCIQDESAAKYKSISENTTTQYLNTQSSICHDGYGLQSSWDQNLHKCICNTGYYLDKNNQCSLPTSCPSNSSLISGKCYCNDGYVLNNGKCITYSASCQSIYGQYSYGDKNYCYCSSGYSWNNDKTSCILNTPAIIPPAIINKTEEKIEPIKIDEKTCSNGLVLSLDKKNCINIPENAHAVTNSLTDVWLCNDGYNAVDNLCVAIEQKGNARQQNIEGNNDSLPNQAIIDTSIGTKSLDNNNVPISQNNNSEKGKGIRGFIDSIFNFFKNIFSFWK